MTPSNWEFEAPWLQSNQGHPEAALGAAIWLWMHDPKRRRESVQDMEHRLLAPIEAGQYLIARQGPGGSAAIDAPLHPLALLLFARFDEKAESRYLAAPTQRIAMRDWQSGDRLWLIDWVAPFGHTTKLRGPIMAMLAGRAAKSFCQPKKGSGMSTRVLLWQSAFTRTGSTESRVDGHDARCDRTVFKERKEPAHW